MFIMKHVANQLNIFYVASHNFSLTYTCITFYSLKTLESILYNVSILKNKNRDVFFIKK